MTMDFIQSCLSYFLQLDLKGNETRRRLDMYSYILNHEDYEGLGHNHD